MALKLKNAETQKNQQTFQDVRKYVILFKWTIVLQGVLASF